MLLTKQKNKRSYCERCSTRTIFKQERGKGGGKLRQHGCSHVMGQHCTQAVLRSTSIVELLSMFYCFRHLLVSETESLRFVIQRIQQSLVQKAENSRSKAEAKYHSEKFSATENAQITNISIQNAVIVINAATLVLTIPNPKTFIAILAQLHKSTPINGNGFYLNFACN